jgi:hypothetical protein
MAEADKAKGGAASEADIGEGGDETEHDAEADHVGREQPCLAQMHQHLPQRCRQRDGAHHIALARQHKKHGQCTERGEAGIGRHRKAPAHRLGQCCGDEPPGKSADRSRGNEQPGHAGRFARRPFAADISDRHGKDRRQQQALHEAPGEQRLEAVGIGHHDVGDDQQGHRDGDDPAASEHVRHHARKRRGQCDGQRIHRHDLADPGRAYAEFVRQHRQHRLRGIHVEHGNEAGQRDGGAGHGDQHRSAGTFAEGARNIAQARRLC